MVQIEYKDDDVIFNVKGLHKLWALKSSLTVSKDSIVAVAPYDDRFGYWPGWRIPGTSIPGIITAGTYYRDGNKYFWDVCKKKKSIMVTLKNDKYNMLIVEVENVEEALENLKVKIAA